MSNSDNLAHLLDRRRQLVDQLKPLVERTAQPQFDMSDEEFSLMDALSRDLENLNSRIFKLGGAAVRPGPTTEQ